MEVYRIIFKELLIYKYNIIECKCKNEIIFGQRRPRDTDFTVSWRRPFLWGGDDELCMKPKL